MRREAAAKCRDLLKAARDDVASEARAGNAKAVQTTAIGVKSAYRGYAEDGAAWLNTFNKHYERMVQSRAYAPDNHGAGALRHMVATLMPLKAPPGFSNHSNGNAVDFTTTMSGVIYAANSDQHTGWRATWLHIWLVKNAKSHGFKPLASEEWHWDYA